jgi:hypothetical protein
MVYAKSVAKNSHSAVSEISPIGSRHCVQGILQLGSSPGTALFSGSDVFSGTICLPALRLDVPDSADVSDFVKGSSRLPYLAAVQVSSAAAPSAQVDLSNSFDDSCSVSNLL